VDLISDKSLYQLFEMLSENKFSKEAIPTILEFLADNPDKNVKKAIAELGIKPMSTEELQKVMKFARNRIDGKLVKDVVKTKLGTSVYE